MGTLAGSAHRARVTPRPAPTQKPGLSGLNRRCAACGGPLGFAYENDRTVPTLEAVVGLTLQIRRGVNAACARDHRPYRPAVEGRLALPHPEFGLGVFCSKVATDSTAKLPPIPDESGH